ncbi:MAG: LysM peptidoglycan-binding domain-containing protein [Betaproteobacteria bacterium]
MFRYIITLLMFCCISFHVNAEVVALKNNHPDRHVVVKGDTLWGISAKFLKDPWQWPKVWQLNRAQIKNPHLIYPGDVVFLDMSSGTPQLRLLRETITLEPGSVVEPLDKVAISTIPLNVIGPFLNQPLVIEKNQFDASPRIVAGQDNRVVLSPGTRVYISQIEEGDGVDWYVYRPGNNLIDPDTKEVLGMEAIYLGDAKVTKYGEPASADIVKAKEEIFTKDRLVAATDIMQTSFVPHAPDIEIRGRIINIYGGVGETGAGSIVSISRGSSNGIEIGHVLAINRYGRVIKDPEFSKEKDRASEAKLKELNFDVNRDAEGKPIVNFRKDATNANNEPLLEPGMIKLPDERVGLLMVFRVFDRVSYGLIMQSTQPINEHDTVQTP